MGLRQFLRDLAIVPPLWRRGKTRTGSPSAPDVVSQHDFARLVSVTPDRVRLWIAQGRIGTGALIGEGHGARIRVPQAIADLSRPWLNRRPAVKPKVSSAPTDR